MFWIAGGSPTARRARVLWLVALAIDYGGPLCTFWVPGCSRLPMSAWELEISHFAERFQLFVILALGESIVDHRRDHLGEELDRGAAGGVRGRVPRHRGDVVAVLQLRGARSRSAGWSWPPTARRLARDAYTYLHVVMVAGVIVAAVGDELVIAHPGEVLHGAELVAVVAGPAIYLLAQAALPAADGGDAERQAARRRGRVRAPRAASARTSPRSRWPRCSWRSWSP